jgi:hypothetical protein
MQLDNIFPFSTKMQEMAGRLAANRISTCAPDCENMDPKNSVIVPLANQVTRANLCMFHLNRASVIA